MIKNSLFLSLIISINILYGSEKNILPKKPMKILPSIPDDLSTDDLSTEYQQIVILTNKSISVAKKELEQITLNKKVVQDRIKFLEATPVYEETMFKLASLNQEIRFNIPSQDLKKQRQFEKVLKTQKELKKVLEEDPNYKEIGLLKLFLTQLDSKKKEVDNKIEALERVLSKKGIDLGGLLPESMEMLKKALEKEAMLADKLKAKEKAAKEATAAKEKAAAKEAKEAIAARDLAARELAATIAAKEAIAAIAAKEAKEAKEAIAAKESIAAREAAAREAAAREAAAREAAAREAV